MTLQEHGIPFTNFFAATLAALLVGKAVLVVDNLPFMHHFDGAPLIQPILFKSAIYWVCVFVFRVAEGLFHSCTRVGRSVTSRTSSSPNSRGRAFSPSRSG